MANPQLPPEVANDLAALFHSLSHNPKTRKIIAKAVKEAAPDSPHARAFTDVDMQDEFERFRDEQEQRDLKKQGEARLRQMNEQRAALLTGGPDGTGRKYSEDDLKKIDKLMEDRQIFNYDDGATLYAATLPPIDPRPPSEIPEHGATWEFPEWSKFSENADKAARNTAHSMIGEFMRKR